MYQGTEGATGCEACPDGFTCPRGSSVPLPAACGPGTYPQSVADSASDLNCTECARGFECVGGARPPKACRPGTHAPRGGMSDCAPCDGGSWQNESVALSCKPCKVSVARPSPLSWHPAANCPSRSEPPHLRRLAGGKLLSSRRFSAAHVPLRALLGRDQPERCFRVYSSRSGQQCGCGKPSPNVVPPWHLLGHGGGWQLLGLHRGQLSEGGRKHVM